MPASAQEDELRIALVMTGGVSLAVWIGGVSREIGRLLARSSAYGELCALTRTSPRVDVISGTSAGGINGAYIAMAAAYYEGPALDTHLAGLRGLWVNQGSFQALLRDPFTRAPASLLDGDGYFLNKLRIAFRGLLPPGGEPLPATQAPIELVITTTLLEGEQRVFADDFGAQIYDTDHRARLHFTRHRRGKNGAVSDDFQDPLIAERLALAARCTSSFPAAFEPSLCPVGADAATGERPDMAGIASFRKNSFVIDGGVLDNRPLDVALDEIFRQRATGPVRRVLAYIVPDPGATARPAVPDATAEPPDMLQVMLASVAQIPSIQSVSAQLDELRDRNRRVREQRAARALLTNDNEPREIDALAGKLFAAYRVLRVQTAADAILELIEAGLVSGSRRHVGFGHRGRREWIDNRIRDQLDTLPWIPAGRPGDAAFAAERTVAGWRWGVRPVEHAIRVLMAVLGQAQRLARLTPNAGSDSLSPAWDSAYDLLEGISRLRDGDKQYWSAQAEPVRKWLGTGHGTGHRAAAAAPQAAARAWLTTALHGWGAGGIAQPGDDANPAASVQQRAGTFAAQIAQVLLDAWGPIASLLEAAGRLGDRRDRDAARQWRDAEALRKFYRYFVRAPGTSVEAIVARLLSFEVVTQVLGGLGTLEEQEIDVVQISAEGPSAFDGRRGPAEKLAGVQMAHFGAFYKSSWRANDWMWGRVDAVRRLVRILLDPERVRQISLTVPALHGATRMANRIADIALGDSEDEAYGVLERALERRKLSSELAYLDNPDLLMPEYLEIAVTAVSRRLELEILREELPRVATAMDVDTAEGARLSERALAFRNEFSRDISDRPLAAARISDLLAACDVGTERVADDIGSDRLTTLAAHATTVAVAAVARQKGWLESVGSLMAMLRAPSLLFYLFARTARPDQRIGRDVTLAVFVAGLMIAITSGFTNVAYPDWVLLAGWIGFLTAGLFLVTRFPWFVRVLLVVALGVGIVAFIAHGLRHPEIPPGIWPGVALAEFLLLMLFLFGRVFVGSRGGNRLS